MEAGERWALIGPNGAGKTTLMGVAGAECHPSEGVAAVLGHRLGTTDLRELRARIGHVDATMAARFRPRATATDVVRSGVTGTIRSARSASRPADRPARGGAARGAGVRAPGRPAPS